MSLVDGRIDTYKPPSFVASSYDLRAQGAQRLARASAPVKKPISDHFGSTKEGLDIMATQLREQASELESLAKEANEEAGALKVAAQGMLAAAAALESAAKEIVPVADALRSAATAIESASQAIKEVEAQLGPVMDAHGKIVAHSKGLLARARALLGRGGK